MALILSLCFRMAVRSTAVHKPKWNEFAFGHNKIKYHDQMESFMIVSTKSKDVNLRAHMFVYWKMFTLLAQTNWVFRLIGLHFPISAIFQQIAPFECWLSANWDLDSSNMKCDLGVSVFECVCDLIKFNWIYSFTQYIHLFGFLSPEKNDEH